MPGAPMSCRSCTTSGVITPRSSAMMGTSPSCCASARNSHSGYHFVDPSLLLVAIPLHAGFKPADVLRS